MSKQSGRQALFLGFLLLLVCVVRLDALKSPRGVRGSSSSSSSKRIRRNENDVDGLVLEQERDLQTVFKKDKNKNKEEEAVIESAQGEDEEEATEEELTTDPPKDDEETDEPTDEPTDPPKDDKQEEEEEPTEEPTPEDIEENEEDQDEEDQDEEDQDETVVETEAPVVVDPDDMEDEPENTPDEEDEDEQDEEEVTSEAPVEETSEPVEVPQTDAPVILPDPDILQNDTAVSSNVTDDMYTIDLAPFTIEIDYEEIITQDPGIEEYLYTEMIRGGANNLDEIDLDLTVATVYSRDRRRRLKSQVLYYTGTALFGGPPVYEQASVQYLQNQILTNEEAVSVVIAESLGEDPGNFTVTSVTVEVTAPVQPEENGATADGSQNPDNNDQLSTTGLAIVIIAACIGAISLTIICLVAVRKPSQNMEPYAGDLSRSLKASAKQVATDDDDEAAKEGAPDLNKTFETEDDQVHEEFAQNMEDHTFDKSWDKKGPVHMQASVGRGSFQEVESDNEKEKDQDPSTNTNPEELKKELGQQLSELQASVKAAREKTQKLLDESKGQTS